LANQAIYSVDQLMQKGGFMKRWRPGLNPLGLIAGIVMIAAMFFPWWSFRVSVIDQTDLFPYLVSGPASELLGYKRSPQMTLLTGVLIACILFCLIGSLLRGKSGRILLAVSGILVFLATWRLMARIGGVAARFNVPIQGHGWGNYGGFAKVEVWTWFQPGLYIILIGGALALIACLLHKQLQLKR
jgi:hypothetical protein